MNTGIELVQSPIIKQNLAFMGSQVTERLKDLNIDGQIATVDTVKALKDLRAELNKELTDFEQQRKLIKEAVLRPYNEFEELYKDQISEKYKSAIDTLKDKIATVEDEVKRAKKANLEAYFKELCIAEKIDFLKFENTGLEINLSTSEKQYKDRINDLIEHVKDDLALIDTQEWKAEILVEYKATMNTSRAIKAIQDRKEKERLEQERIRLAEIERRKQLLRMNGFRPNEFICAYEFDEDILMTETEIDTLDKVTFANTMDLLTVKIAEKKRVEVMKREEAERIEMNRIMSQPPIMEPACNTYVEPVQAPVVQAPVITEALEAPKVVEAPKLVTAIFEVTGTREQLYSLKNFLITNNINYTNV